MSAFGTLCLTPHEGIRNPKATLHIFIWREFYAIGEATGGTLGVAAVTPMDRL
jgi:hypothetical protein